MTRKECYEFIKAHNLKDEATKLAHDIYGDMPKINWTNLTSVQLEKFVYDHLKKSEPKKTTCKKSNNKCTDDGARKAILAIAKILNLKNIERNFN